MIGSKKNIGSKTGGVYARRTSETSPDNEEIIWNYKDKGWEKDTNKDINLRCINRAGSLSVRKIGKRSIPG